MPKKTCCLSREQVSCIVSLGILLETNLLKVRWRTRSINQINPSHFQQLSINQSFPEHSHNPLKTDY
jgi:hypothetical protein